MTTFLQRQIVADAAESIALGHHPYVFGGAGPQGFDCSGLVRAAWATVGVDVAHNAAQQARLTGMLAPNQDNREKLLPGDLVYYYGGTWQKVTHVALFLRFHLGFVVVAQATDEAHGTEVIRQGKYVNPTGYGLMQR